MQRERRIAQTPRGPGAMLEHPGLVPDVPDRLSDGARLALDVAWALPWAVEVRDLPSARLTTTSLLLALCDLARIDARPRSATLVLLRDDLPGSWGRVATARAAYLAGAELQEPPVCGSSTLSENALRVLRLARLLSQESDTGWLRLRHLLGAILLLADVPAPCGAQQLLAQIGADLALLRQRCPR